MIQKNLLEFCVSEVKIYHCELGWICTLGREIEIK